MKYNPIARYAVDQKPIRIHMALSEACVFSFQSMLPESIGQRLRDLKQFEKVLKRFVFERVSRKLSLQATKITFESSSEDNFLHKRLRCAIASLAVLKRRVLPSRSSRRDCSSPRRATAFNS